MSRTMTEDAIGWDRARRDMMLEGMLAAPALAVILHLVIVPPIPPTALWGEPVVNHRGQVYPHNESAPRQEAQ